MDNFIKFFKFLCDLKRKIKFVVQIFFDCFIFFISYFFALFLDKQYNLTYDKEFYIIFVIVLLSTILVLLFSGFYKNIIRHASPKILFLCVVASISSIILVYVLFYFTKIPISASFLLLFFFFFTTGVFQSRLMVRYLYLLLNKPDKIFVAVYGAGETGRQLALSVNNSYEYEVKIFIDDDVEIQGYNILGVKIYSFNEAKKVFKDKNIKVILMAIPNITKIASDNILFQLKNYPVKVKYIPRITDVLKNNERIDKFQSITIENLLERTVIKPKIELMSKNLYKKNVLVTGAGGSIGSEICRQIINYRPDKLVLLDNSEVSLFKINNEIEETLNSNFLKVNVQAVICSIQNEKQLKKHIKNNNIHTIFHAAAYKHVPLVEQNPFEAVKNNIFGTKNIVEIATQCCVETFILISSDKAVRPTNIMGATKRFSELVCLNHKIKNYKTSFFAVRFGNVLGSSGSVIPIFQKQIEKGGPITVTHEQVTRYFMTISEAAQLVIQAGSLSKKRDVFLLDMGAPHKILDLAKKMVLLQGLTPYIKGKDKEGDIEIKIVGLRQGEKLYEELLVDNKANLTIHPRIMSEKNKKIDQYELNAYLKDLSKACLNNNLKGLLTVFENSGIGFVHKLNKE